MNQILIIGAGDISPRHERLIAMWTEHYPDIEVVREDINDRKSQGKEWHQMIIDEMVDYSAQWAILEFKPKKPAPYYRQGERW